MEEKKEHKKVRSKWISKEEMEELMKIFLRRHIVEQTGHGVFKVVRKYGVRAYDFGTSTITVRIPFDRSGFKRGDVPANVSVRQADEDEII